MDWTTRKENLIQVEERASAWHKYNKGLRKIGLCLIWLYMN